MRLSLNNVSDRTRSMSSFFTPRRRIVFHTNPRTNMLLVSKVFGLRALPFASNLALRTRATPSGYEMQKC